MGHELRCCALSFRLFGRKTGIPFSLPFSFFSFAQTTLGLHQPPLSPSSHCLITLAVTDKPSPVPRPSMPFEDCPKLDEHCDYETACCPDYTCDYNTWKCKKTNLRPTPTPTGDIKAGHETRRLLPLRGIFFLQYVGPILHSRRGVGVLSFRCGVRTFETRDKCIEHGLAPDGTQLKGRPR